MSRLCILAVGILTVGAAAIEAQTLPKEYAEMAAAMQSAQARAVRAGDEALPCSALEKELVSSMNAPAIQAYADKSAAAAQKQATPPDKTKAPMTPQAAAALAASLGAGGGAEQMKQLIPIMPQIMRSQRLMQLAVVKQCTWMVGASPFAPPLPAR